MTEEDFKKACQERLNAIYEERVKGKSKYYTDPFKVFSSCAPTLRIETNQAIMLHAKSWQPPEI
jgi:hypothetical protein